MFSAGKRTALAGLACAVLLVTPLAAQEERDVEDEIQFEESLQLLSLEMRLRAVQRLAQRGFYFAPRRLERYRKEYMELQKSLRSGSSADLSLSAVWTDEVAKSRTTEKSVMLDLAKSFGRKIIKAAVSGSRQGESAGLLRALRDWESQVTRWQRDKKASARSIAGYVLQIAKEHSDEARGKGFEVAARRLYRGAILESDALIDGMVILEKRRMALAASIKALNEINKGLVVLEAVENPGQFLERQVEAKVVEYLAQRYPGSSPENVAWAVGLAKKVGSNAWAAWTKAGQIEGDPNLGHYPGLKNTCKNFAYLEGVFKTAVDVLESLEIGPTLGPLLDVAKFYVDAIGLVPTIAQKMAALYDRTGQVVLGRTGLWSEVKVKHVPDILCKTTLMRHFNVPIAVPQVDHDETSDRYYLLLPKKFIPRGYATLDNAQYNRLCEALCSERVLFARVGSLSKEYVKHLGRVDREEEWPTILAPGAHASYVTALRAEASKQPFKPKQLFALAQGGAVTHLGRKWTADKLRWRADQEMERFADEMIVREALPKWSHANLKQWWEFKNLLAEYAITLTPKQMLGLFKHYVTPPGSANVKRSLEREKRRRAARRLGVPSVGVPMVTIPTDDEFTPGSTASLQAVVVVGDLKPGHEVAAKVSWTLPSWAGGQTYAADVKLRNGRQSVGQRVKVPSNMNEKTFDAKVTVTVSPWYCDAPIVAVGHGRFERGEGKIFYFGPFQYPTREGGQDIPEEQVVGTKKSPQACWPNWIQELFVVFLRPGDPMCQSYLDIVERSGFRPAAPQLERLMAEGGKRSFRAGPIQLHQGPNIIRIDCAGQTRYRYLCFRGDRPETLGSFDFYGMPVGSHEARLTASTAAGERLTGRLRLRVDEQKFSRREVIRDENKQPVVDERGKTRYRKVDGVRTIALVKAEEEKRMAGEVAYWEGRRGKQKYRAMRTSLRMFMSAFDKMRKTPHCTAADLLAVLQRCAETMRVLWSCPFKDDPEVYNVVDLTRLGAKCVTLGDRPAYELLARLDASAGGTSRNALGGMASRQRLLASIAFTMGEFEVALEHLEKHLKHRLAIRPKLDVDAEKAWWPPRDRLKDMKKLLQPDER